MTIAALQQERDYQESGAVPSVSASILSCAPRVLRSHATAGCQDDEIVVPDAPTCRTRNDVLYNHFLACGLSRAPLNFVALAAVLIIAGTTAANLDGEAVRET